MYTVFQSVNEIINLEWHTFVSDEPAKHPRNIDGPSCDCSIDERVLVSIDEGSLASLASPDKESFVGSSASPAGLDKESFVGSSASFADADKGLFLGSSASPAGADKGSFVGSAAELPVGFGKWSSESPTEGSGPRGSMPWKEVWGGERKVRERGERLRSTREERLRSTRGKRLRGERRRMRGGRDRARPTSRPAFSRTA